MKAQIAGTVRLGKITPEQAKLCFTILKPTTKIEDLQICDLVSNIKIEARHDKTNKMSVRPPKTQISLGIHLV